MITQVKERGLVLPSIGVKVEKQMYPPSADSVLYLPGYPPLGATIRDFSGQGNHGTITGATWTRLPSGLWVLDFDGNDDYVGCGAVTTLGERTFEFWLKTPHTVANGGFLGFASFGGIGFGSVGATPLLFLSGSNYQYFVDVSALYYNNNWHFWQLYIAGSGQNEIDNCSLTIDGNTIGKGEKLKTAAPDAWTTFVIGSMLYGKIDGVFALERVYTRDQRAMASSIYNRERHLFGR